MPVIQIFIELDFAGSSEDMRGQARQVFFGDQRAQHLQVRRPLPTARPQEQVW